MRTFRKKYNLGGKTKKGGQSNNITQPKNNTSTQIVSEGEKLENIKGNINEESSINGENYNKSLQGSKKYNTDNQESSFFEILKKNNINPFDKLAPETKLDDLGISVKPLSKEAQDFYYKNALFPLTVFYYNNDEESRNQLGLNYSEMKSVSVNKLLTTSNVFQCTDLETKNSNYNEENIKQQDNKPIVIGSNIFEENPENINLNNNNSLFNKTIFEASKTDSSVKQDFLRQARLKKFGQTAGADVENIRGLQNTTTLADKLDGLYWFSTHNYDTHTRKIEQFINYYMFSQNYQYNNNSISQILPPVDGNTTANISVISDFQKTIMSLSTPTEMYSAMPGWVKARGVGFGIGSMFSLLSTVSFGRAARDTVSGLGTTEQRTISYNNLNLITPTEIAERTYIVSAIDKKHLLYSIFFKILVEIDNDEFNSLCELLDIDEYYITILDENRVNFQRILNGNIPYHLFIENLYFQTGGHEIKIQTVINNNYDDSLFVYREFVDHNPEYCMPIWNDCLSKLYFYFIRGTIENYTVESTYIKFRPQFTLASGLVPAQCGSIISDGDYSNGNIMKYSYIDISPPVTFTPKDYSENGRNYGASRESGYGNITDGKGKLWFYNTQTGVVANEDNSITTNPNNPQSWGSVGTTGNVFSTVNSRITNGRSEILCYLSELIYSPNDIVKKVSNTMFGANEPANTDNSRIIYIGAYDDDPSYPYAFDSADNNTVKPSYSRIHAWLYINNNFNYQTVTLDNVPALELYIVNRGSKTGLDWEDIDKCISEGTALYNERPMSYAKILYKILNDLDNSFDNINQLMKPSLQRGAQPPIYNRNIQIISSGHSLGGFLGLYFSFMSLSRNIIENFTSNPNGTVAGIRSRNGRNPAILKVNKYILPIVFQPYVKTEPIMKTYNKIPYGIINTVFNAHRVSTPIVYVDAASVDFFSYIEANRGDLKVCKYENVYLDKKISSMNSSLFRFGSANYNRYIEIAINAHALWQMSGLCLKYYAEHIKTDYYVKAKIGANWINQNLEVTKYQFNFNNDCILYGADNVNGIPFTTQDAINNIMANVTRFLANPNDTNRVGGKYLKKNITKKKTNRKSKRKTQKIKKICSRK